jgi:hypothetical protein
MTEVEWLGCADPYPMLAHLKGRVSERKLRLLACACQWFDRRVRSVPRADETIALAERYADGEVTCDVGWAELGCPELGTEGWDPIWALLGLFWAQPFHAAVVSLPTPDQDDAPQTGSRRHACDLVRCVFGTPFPRRSVRKNRWLARAALGLLSALGGHPTRPSEPTGDEVLPSPICSPGWLTDTVLALARQMYASREFSAMPILADALQDAGCEEEQILNHCRGPGPHVRGCWVVDSVLGKE